MYTTPLFVFQDEPGLTYIPLFDATTSKSQGLFYAEEENLSFDFSKNWYTHWIIIKNKETTGSGIFQMIECNDNDQFWVYKETNRRPSHSSRAKSERPPNPAFLIIKKKYVGAYRPSPLFDDELLEEEENLEKEKNTKSDWVEHGDPPGCIYVR